MRIILRVSALLAAISLLLCAGPYGPRFDTISFAHHRRSYVDAQDARGIGVFSTRTRQDAAQPVPDISGVWLMEKIKFALFANKDNPLQKGGCSSATLGGGEIQGGKRSKRSQLSLFAEGNPVHVSGAYPNGNLSSAERIFSTRGVIK